MEQFKLEYSARDHPGEAFPRITQLLPHDVDRLRGTLCQRLDLEAESGWQKILKCLSDRAKRVESVDAEADNAFDLRSVVAALQVTAAEHAYLGDVWSRYFAAGNTNLTLDQSSVNSWPYRGGSGQAAAQAPRSLFITSTISFSVPS